MERKGDFKKHLQTAAFLTRLLDTQFSILGIRFGIDPIFDLIPGFGSAVSALLSAYILLLAYEAGAPPRIFFRMLWHIVVDYLLGLFPFVGIVFDLMYKANVKNIELLRQHLDDDPVLEGIIIDHPIKKS